MKRLEALLQQLCPDGVIYKRLGDIATITRGGNFQKKDYRENGFPCIHYGQIYTKLNLFVTEPISHISDEKAAQQKKAKPGDIIMAVTSENIEDVCKCIAWLGNREIAVSGHAVIIHHQLNPKFLTYFLNSSLFYKQKLSMAQGTKVIEVSPEKLKNILLPIPPLEVQQEIVRILDHFTELTAELTEKLTAELTAREKQYQYYRCQLLTFNSSVPRRTLSEVCNILSGGDAPKNEMSKEKTEHHKIPIISNGVEGNDIYGYTNIKKIETPAVTIAARGTIGYAAYRDYPYFPIIRLLSAIPKDTSLLDTKFLYYCLRDKQYNIPQSGIPQLTSPQLKKVEIFLPPLPEQHRIVSILDRFDAMCNDLTSGLPAEIAARQKQYEYYRDKLLTFKEKL